MSGDIVKISEWSSDTVFLVDVFLVDVFLDDDIDIVSSLKSVIYLSDLCGIIRDDVLLDRESWLASNSLKSSSTSDSMVLSNMDVWTFSESVCIIWKGFWFDAIEFILDFWEGCDVVMTSSDTRGPW